MARKQIRFRVPKRNKMRLESLSRRMLLTWFILAGLIFFFAPQTLTNKFQLAFAHIFRWPLSIGRNFSLAARTQQPLTDVISRREYNKLQNHLTNIIAQRNGAYKKIEELSGLRERPVLEGAKIAVADVITASIGGSHSELIINRGENEGLDKGQFVLGDNSIIGIISDVSSRTARVKLITDPTSKIAVKIAKSNTGWIMQGCGNNSAKVSLIKHKVEAGDIVYACKKPGLLDAPMIAGKVGKCERNDESPLLWDITVKPVCNIERLSDVAVIIMNPQE